MDLGQCFCLVGNSLILSLLAWVWVFSKEEKARGEFKMAT
jgi:hypothetical protein